MKSLALLGLLLSQIAMAKPWIDVNIGELYKCNNIDPQGTPVSVRFKEHVRQTTALIKITVAGEKVFKSLPFTPGFFVGKEGATLDSGAYIEIYKNEVNEWEVFLGYDGEEYVLACK